MSNAPKQKQKGASKNNGTPKSSHLFIGFSIMFTTHFGWFSTPIFGGPPKTSETAQ